MGIYCEREGGGGKGDEKRNKSLFKDVMVEKRKKLQKICLVRDNGLRVVK